MQQSLYCSHIYWDGETSIDEERYVDAESRIYVAFLELTLHTLGIESIC